MKFVLTFPRALFSSLRAFRGGEASLIIYDKQRFVKALYKKKPAFKAGAEVRFNNNGRIATNRYA